MTDLEFTYADTDTHLNEIAELYSYTEHPEFQQNVKAFEDQMEMYKLKPLWQQLSKSQHEGIILKLVDQLEVLDDSLRMKSARTLLYLAQGCWVEVLSDEEQQSLSRYNVMMLYRLGDINANNRKLYLSFFLLFRCFSSMCRVVESRNRKFSNS